MDKFKKVIKISVGLTVLYLVVRGVSYVVTKIKSASEINIFSLFVAITGLIILILYFYKKK